MLNVITIADHSIIGEYIVINYPTSTSAQENLFNWQLVALVLDRFSSSSTQAIQTQYCIEKIAVIALCRYRISHSYMMSNAQYCQ